MIHQHNHVRHDALDKGVTDIQNGSVNRVNYFLKLCNKSLRDAQVHTVLGDVGLWFLPYDLAMIILSRHWDVILPV